jgi:hypothetical protein
LTPGRLQLQDEGSRKAGVYIELNSGEFVITSNLEYYAKNPNCNYKWIPSENGKPVVDAVETVSGTVIYYIGRTFAYGSLQVGKVFVSRGMFYTHNGRGYKVLTYEVLICDCELEGLVTEF